MSKTPDAAPRKRRPRSRDLAAAGEVFGDFTPWRNPSAVYSYVTSLIGLTPILGLILGPLAVALGFRGRAQLRRNPDVRGGNFAAAGMILGSIDFFFNLAGLACLGHGLGWW
jgi:hypothetical protein